jgi:hypothetical protein
MYALPNNAPPNMPTGSIHISGILSRDHPDWVLVSTYSKVNTLPYTHAGDHEIWLMNFITGDVKRVAHTHNVRDPVSDKEYFSETQASSNYAGTKLIFKSGWGTAVPNQHIETYVITGTFW